MKTAQWKQIINLLEDGEWHCLTNELYMKDDRARISHMNKGTEGNLLQRNLKIEGKHCDFSGHNHNSRLYMRRLVSKENAQESPIVKEFREEYAARGVQGVTNKILGVLF